MKPNYIHSPVARVTPQVKGVTKLVNNEAERTETIEKEPKEVFFFNIVYCV